MVKENGKPTIKTSQENNEYKKNWLEDTRNFPKPEKLTWVGPVTELLARRGTRRPASNRVCQRCHIANKYL